jgi:hypothetical protein
MKIEKNKHSSTQQWKYNTDSKNTQKDRISDKNKKNTTNIHISFYSTSPQQTVIFMANQKQK